MLDTQTTTEAATTTPAAALEARVATLKQELGKLNDDNTKLAKSLVDANAQAHVFAAEKKFKEAGDMQEKAANIQKEQTDMQARIATMEEELQAAEVELLNIANAKNASCGPDPAALEALVATLKQVASRLLRMLPTPLDLCSLSKL